MAEAERAVTGKKFDKKLIVDCDDETISNLGALSHACERSNAWVVRRLIETAFFKVYPNFYTEDGKAATKVDVDALKESGLLGLNFFFHDEAVSDQSEK